VIKNRDKLCKKFGLPLAKETWKWLKAEKVDIRAALSNAMDNTRDFKDVSKICASRIPTKQEVDTGLRIAERVERIVDLIRVLEPEIVVRRNTRVAASSLRDVAREEVNGYEKCLKVIDEQLKRLETSEDPELQ
jgi:hypothetical protein